MARQAEAEREKRAKIIAAEGESLAADQLGAASDVMMAHPLALQLRNLQSLVEIGVDKNTTVVFPAPLMSTIQELGAFLAREQAAGATPPQHRHHPPSPPGCRRRTTGPTDRPPPLVTSPPIGFQQAWARGGWEQVLIVAVQNSVDRCELGIATAASRADSRPGVARLIELDPPAPSLRPPG
jgi:hypothetical protein